MKTNISETAARTGRGFTAVFANRFFAYRTFSYGKHSNPVTEFIFPRDVTGMGKGFAFAAKFHAEMIGCHTGLALGRARYIDLLDDEDSLCEADRRLLHVLATAEKNDLQSRDESRKLEIQKRIEG